MLIFVTGAHGSGKTTLCGTLQSHYKAKHLVASDIIRKQLGKVNWDDKKQVNDPENNQKILIEYINKTKSENLVFLDGHSVLRTNAGTYTVPLSFIKQLAPKGIILVKANAIDLHRRANTYYIDMQSAVTMLVEENNITDCYCSELGIPKLLVNTSLDISYKEIFEFIDGLVLT